MERPQFTFYRSFADAAARIRSKAARCDYYEAIINYALHEQEPDFSGIADSAAMGFVLIRPTLDASRQKAIGGQRGGKAEANRRQGETESISEADGKHPATEKEKEREKEDEKENENEEESHRSAFTAAEREQMITDSLRGFSEELRETVRSWTRYKTERREPYKRVGFAALLSRIAESARDYGDRAVVDVISQSMSSGYKGILFDRLNGGGNHPQRGSMAGLHRKQPSLSLEEYRKLVDGI